MNIVFYIILFCIMPKVVFCQSEVKYEKLNYVCSFNEDTIFFASSKENGNVEDIVKGLGFILLEKNKNEYRIIFKKTFSPYIYKYDFYIEDFNLDGRNDILIIDADEGFYSINIYEIIKSDSSYVVENVYKKQGIDGPLYHKAIEIQKKGNKVNRLIFYSLGDNGEDISFELKYDKKKMKFGE